MHGLRGHKRPDTLKVTAFFEGMWLARRGLRRRADALAPARRADVLQQRLKLRGLPVRARFDLIGIGSVLDSDAGTLWRSYDGPQPPELRIRLAAEGADRDAVDQARGKSLLCFAAARRGPVAPAGG